MRPILRKVNSAPLINALNEHKTPGKIVKSSSNEFLSELAEFADSNINSSNNNEKELVKFGFECIGEVCEFYSMNENERKTMKFSDGILLVGSALFRVAISALFHKILDALNSMVNRGIHPH